MKFYLYLLIIMLFPAFNSCKSDNSFVNQLNEITTEIKKEVNLYDELQLQNVISPTAFEYAYTGYNTTSPSSSILTVIDFSKPSTAERMAVIDLENKKLLFTTHVSHGKNSGDNYATTFSNVSGSNKSSLGFYMTQETYQGKNGYSLRLAGLEKGINDNARARAIVIHGADYSNPSVIKSMGRLGRSEGCPALPHAVNKDIIDVIKNGSLLFIYGNDKDYLNKSTVLAAFPVAFPNPSEGISPL